MKDDTSIAQYVIFALVLIGVVTLIFLFALWLNRAIFKHLRKKNGESIHYTFLEKFIRTLLIIFYIIVIVSLFVDAKETWTTILGGTAVIGGVVAFISQDIIKDILAGFMISIYKPFTLGDRIVLDDGTSGIVEDITMRHVILKGVDTNRIIVPNYKLNDRLINNYSYRADFRSMFLTFPVGYDTDLEKAKEIMMKVISESEYTIPRKYPDGREAYSQILFREIRDSSLILGVTVYYEKNKYPTEIVLDEINTGIFKAFTENGIEIPYNYMNVVSKDN